MSRRGLKSENQRRASACIRKVAYETKDEANVVVKEMKEVNLARGQKQFLNVYECEFCGKYHFGRIGRQTLLARARTQKLS
jgi:hypothetical protein